MKNIKTLIPVLLIIANQIACNPVLAMASVAGLQIPIRLVSDLDSSTLGNASAVAIQVVDDVYSRQQLLFKQGQSGYAKIDRLDKGGFFGRGGKIDINSGSITDLQGVTHTITFNLNANGNRKLSSAAGTLMGGAVAYNLASQGLRSKTVTGTVFGLGSVLVPIAYARQKGEGAHISSGAVVVATIVN